MWSSVKDQIVQPVPQDIQVCEFYCTRKQCSLEVTGWCEIRPRPALILIKRASASARPQWAESSAPGVHASPASVA
jgi:hypothetical protein